MLELWPSWRTKKTASTLASLGRRLRTEFLSLPQATLLQRLTSEFSDVMVGSDQVVEFSSALLPDFQIVMSEQGTAEEARSVEINGRRRYTGFRLHLEKDRAGCFAAFSEDPDPEPHATRAARRLARLVADRLGVLNYNESLRELGLQPARSRFRFL
ncbi:hypothetical protein [Rubellimicrobium arenae]|uniref:hypothetical protein n=1 Tax=Rubellimicrobium arenae TaxID=2817372 RepID=UPI001B306BE9|nr:hypothetical protein [Rubellimicrobium arenae]